MDYALSREFFLFLLGVNERRSNELDADAPRLAQTEENIWESSRHFTVTSSSSQRKWGIQPESVSPYSGSSTSASSSSSTAARRQRVRRKKASTSFTLPSISLPKLPKFMRGKGGKDGEGEDGGEIEDHAEYVPGWGQPHLFRWNGAWIEVNSGSAAGGVGGGGYVAPPSPGMGGGLFGQPAGGGWGGGGGSVTLT